MKVATSSQYRALPDCVCLKALCTLRDSSKCTNGGGPCVLPGYPSARHISDATTVLICVVVGMVLVGAGLIIKAL